MAATEAPQTTREISSLAEVFEIGREIADLLLQAERVLVEITSSHGTFPKPVGGGQEDEGVLETFEEVMSCLHGLAVELDRGRTVAISITTG